MPAKGKLSGGRCKTRGSLPVAPWGPPSAQSLESRPTLCPPWLLASLHGDPAGAVCDRDPLPTRPSRSICRDGAARAFFTAFLSQNLPQSRSHTVPTTQAARSAACFSAAQPGSLHGRPPGGAAPRPGQGAAGSSGPPSKLAHQGTRPVPGSGDSGEGLLLPNSTGAQCRLRLRSDATLLGRDSPALGELSQ